MAADNNWVRLVHTTIAKYLRGVEEAVLRNRILFAMLKKRGRIKMNASGTKLNWKIRFKRAPLQGLLSGDVIRFEQRDQYRTAEIGWRGSIATNAITDFELSQNKGNEAIVKVWDEATVTLGSDMEEGFCDQLYLDGEASGNESFCHGIESFMSVSGASTKMPIGINNDSYAGLLTALASEGGNWSTTGTNTTYTDWPRGRGDSHYDWNTPLVVDATSAITSSAVTGNIGWSSATKGWDNVATEALRFAILGVGRNGKMAGKPSFALMDQGMMAGLRNLLQAEEQLMRSVNQGPASMYSLGFTDTINFDGLDCAWEYGVPPNVCYGWPLELTEIHSLKGQLFNPGGPYFREDDDSYRISSKFAGNMKFGNENGGLRSFFKIGAIS